MTTKTKAAQVCRHCGTRYDEPSDDPICGCCGELIDGPYSGIEPDGKLRDIDSLADDHEHDCYEDEGDAAYGREE